MTGAQMKQLREALGLSVYEMADVIGLNGSRETTGRLVRRFEDGRATLTPRQQDRVAEWAAKIGAQVSDQSAAR